jgi:hypothetical protein
MILVSLVLFAITIWAYCKIFQKAGYHWAFGFLMLVPIANFVMLLYLGFSEWPVQMEVRELRKKGRAEQVPG